VTRIIGVHFPNNNNSAAQDAIGIEIQISKTNNIALVESNTSKRFQIKSFNEVTNFCLAEDYEDTTAVMTTTNQEGKLVTSNIPNEKFKDLLMSEVYELKNLWFVYNKKINTILSILPQEVLGRYDMVAKTLQPPVFDMSRYPSASE
jgi:hypothetical protein